MAPGPLAGQTASVYRARPHVVLVGRSTRVRGEGGRYFAGIPLNAPLWPRRSATPSSATGLADPGHTLIGAARSATRSANPKCEVSGHRARAPWQVRRRYQLAQESAP